MGLTPSKYQPDEKGQEVQNEKNRYMQMLLQQEIDALESADDDQDEDKTDDCQTQGRSNRIDSLLDSTDAAVMQVDPANYEYPFENLVFEGGGNKGLAYVGAVKCLEELDMMGQIKRLGGASAGAITATLVALGYRSNQIRTFLSGDIESVFLDHSWGIFSLLPNLYRMFGWNPGYKIYEWFGDKIKMASQTKNPNMTFQDLYQERQVELCVVVTNVNLKTSEYCHLKTTPDMPIRDALRMTMAIPGVFAATWYDNHGQRDVYVDGGVLCNYPIHCFDGWYLSLAREDAFLNRFRSLKDLPKMMDRSERFKRSTPNKTIGFLLFDDSETEVMRFALEDRIGAILPEKPEKQTELYKKKMESRRIQQKAEREHKRVVRAIDSFMHVLKTHNLDDEYITKDELANAFNDERFTDSQKELLFGKDCSLDTAFALLDKSKDNKIAMLELLQFIQEHGIRMQTRSQGFGRSAISNFFDFVGALKDTLLTNLKLVFVDKEDVDRTVGINTGHVGTSDYSLEDVDRDFAVSRGYNATKSFLRYYQVHHPQEVKRRTATKPDK